jgi:hypothetical protein
VLSKVHVIDPEQVIPVSRCVHEIDDSGDWRGELDSRPPDSVVRAREPDLLPPSGERQSRNRHPAAAPVLLRGALTGNSRRYSGISGVCVERGLWPRLCGGGPSPLRTAIPANREFNREFCRFQRCRRAAGPRQLESIQQIGYALTDYLAAIKQGIPFREQGMIAMEQGFHFR